MNDPNNIAGDEFEDNLNFRQVQQKPSQTPDEYQREQFDILSETCQQTQDNLKQANDALTLFDTLAKAVDQANWTDAVEAGERLLQLYPDLSQPQAWLSQARAKLKAVEHHTSIGSDMTIWEKDGKEMVCIPAGAFLYGDDQQKKELSEFWIDKTPVTNAEYKKFLDATPFYRVPLVKADWAQPYNWDKKTRSFPVGKADHPVVLVDWEDARAYTQWAGKRLPTEEEWEKAVRGTDGRKFSWGDAPPTPELCNFSRNEGGPTPVGNYSPQGDSPYGCVDMSGNIWEWTASDYDSEFKVLRGGSWCNLGERVRAAYRTPSMSPGTRLKFFGFRCAVSPVALSV
jgi:formylglycine-generating enzyme required for sulfatase activity